MERDWHFLHGQEERRQISGAAISSQGTQTRNTTHANCEAYVGAAVTDGGGRCPALGDPRTPCAVCMSFRSQSLGSDNKANLLQRLLLVLVVLLTIFFSSAVRAQGVRTSLIIWLPCVPIGPESEGCVPHTFIAHAAHGRRRFINTTGRSMVRIACDF